MNWLRSCVARTLGHSTPKTPGHQSNHPQNQIRIYGYRLKITPSPLKIFNYLLQMRSIRYGILLRLTETAKVWSHRRRLKVSRLKPAPPTSELSVWQSLTLKSIGSIKAYGTILFFWEYL